MASFTLMTRGAGAAVVKSPALHSMVSTFATQTATYSPFLNQTTPTRTTADDRLSSIEHGLSVRPSTGTWHVHPTQGASTSLSAHAHLRGIFDNHMPSTSKSPNISLLGDSPFFDLLANANLPTEGTPDADHTSSSDHAPSTLSSVVLIHPSLLRQTNNNDSKPIWSSSPAILGLGLGARGTAPPVPSTQSRRSALRFCLPRILRKRLLAGNSTQARHRTLTPYPFATDTPRHLPELVAPLRAQPPSTPLLAAAVKAVFPPVVRRAGERHAVVGLGFTLTVDGQVAPGLGIYGRSAPTTSHGLESAQDLPVTPQLVPVDEDGSIHSAEPISPLCL